MKNFIFYFSLTIVLLSCEKNQNKSIPLFNEIKFQLNEGENLLKIDSKKVKVFNSFFDSSDLKIPLCKCVKSNNSYIYIGIPFNTTLRELANDSIYHNLNQTFYESDSINYFYKKLSNEKEKINIYSTNIKNNLIYVLTISNSEENSDSLFNLKALANRFNN